jgi:hypothetical protein
LLGGRRERSAAPGQHLAAQQSRRLRPNVERRQRGGVLAFRQAAQPRPQGHLRVDVRGELGHADLEGVKDAGHRLAEHRDSPVLPDRGLGEPVLDGLAHLFGQHIVHDRGIRDDEPPVGSDPVNVKHRVEVGDELFTVAVRHSGEHDAERRAALPRVLEDLPDWRVRVAA